MRRRRSIPSFPRIAVTMLLQIILCSKTLFAFVTALSPASSKMANYVLDTTVDQRQDRQKQSMRTVLAAAATTRTTAAAATDTTSELYDTATQLLNLLLEKRNQDIEPPFEAWLRKLTPSYEQVEQERSNAVEALIEKLTVPVVEKTRTPESTGFLDRLLPQQEPIPYYYDPLECLFGSGFYCTLYFYYPTSASGSGGKPPEDPIWEKTSLKATNIKGQQYYVRNDFQQAVINYSEVWGSAVTFKAEGVVTPIDDDDTKSTKKVGSPNSKVKTKKDSRTLRRLPDVFRIDATKISASVFGLPLTFDVKGSANLVVLYADPRIRVFVSVENGETWESNGLVAVQVRGDLVPATDELASQILDLR